MKKLQNTFFIILGFVIIISVIVAIFFSVRFFLSFFNQVNPTVVASLIATSGTILTAVFTVVVGQMVNKKKEIEEAHRVHKTEIYSKFIDFTINFVFSQTREDREAISQQDLENYFIGFSKDLTLWASPEVIKAWLNFRNQTSETNHTSTLTNVDIIYQAMRKDLGNSNKGLSNGSLINLFLKEQLPIS